MLRWAAVCLAAWAVWAWTCNFGPGLKLQGNAGFFGSPAFAEKKKPASATMRVFLSAYFSG
jgi:hypothetical protein